MVEPQLQKDHIEKLTCRIHCPRGNYYNVSVWFQPNLTFVHFLLHGFRKLLNFGNLLTRNSSSALRCLDESQFQSRRVDTLLQLLSYVFRNDVFTTALNRPIKKLRGFFCNQ